MVGIDIRFCSPYTIGSSTAYTGNSGTNGLLKLLPGAYRVLWLARAQSPGTMQALP